MKYELTRSSAKGILIDRTPILRDMRDTYEVSFVLPKNGSYIALFKGEDNIEHKVSIKEGKVKLPKALLGKEQYVSLIVTELSNEAIIQSWECEPLKVTAFLNLRQTQWQVSGGLTEAGALVRITEIEKAVAQYSKDNKALTSNVTKLEETTTSLTQNLRVAIESYNSAIAVINDLSKRLVELEKNYDPTLIK